MKKQKPRPRWLSGRLEKKQLWKLLGEELKRLRKTGEKPKA